MFKRSISSRTFMFCVSCSYFHLSVLTVFPQINSKNLLSRENHNSRFLRALNRSESGNERSSPNFVKHSFTRAEGVGGRNSFLKYLQILYALISYNNLRSHEHVTNLNLNKTFHDGNFSQLVAALASRISLQKSNSDAKLELTWPPEVLLKLYCFLSAFLFFL